MTFAGTESLPPLWAWVMILAVGLGAAAAFVVGGVDGLQHGEPGPVVVAVGALALLGSLVVAGSVWWLRLRREMARLASLETIARRFNQKHADLLHIARQRGIRPRYNVNGHDLYDPAHFRGPSGLLRSADKPEDLLRPMDLRTDRSDRTLLHPSKPPNDD